MKRFHCPNSQAGAALVTSLIILLILSVLGATALSTGVVQLKMSANVQERAIVDAAALTAINTIVRQANEGRDAEAEKRGHIVKDSLDKNPAGNRSNYDNANAEIRCIARDRGSESVSNERCTGEDAWILDENAEDEDAPQRPVRALARSFFRGEIQEKSGCPGYELNDSSVTCKRIEIEGRGWIDIDGNGQDEDQEVSSVQRQSTWLESPKHGTAATENDSE